MRFIDNYLNEQSGKENYYHVSKDVQDKVESEHIERARKIFSKFQSTVSRYKNYAAHKKECVHICEVLSSFVSKMQSLLELNKQAFQRIERYYACSANLVDPGLCWCSDDD